MGGVGAARHPLAALLVPQPDLAGPGARLDRIQRPAPAAAGAPRRARPGAEALAEVDWATGHGSPHSAPWSPITISPTGPSHPPWSHPQRPGPAHAARVIPDDAQAASAADRLGRHRPEGRTGGNIGGIHSSGDNRGRRVSPTHLPAVVAGWRRAVPFRPCSMSNSMSWPSCKVCSPLACTALMCTDTSSPRSGRMKP
jgi:hypothetical protein